MASTFSPETIDFLWGLRLNNNRDWFGANRSVYEAQLLEPIRLLGSRVFEAVRGEFPGAGLNLHISRIYRDARRLFGRGPFKDHLWFSLEQPSEGAPRPGFYFTIAADHYGYGMGFYDAKAATMQAFREEIDRQPTRALALAEAFAAQDTFALCGPEYARPKGQPGGALDRWYNRRLISLEHEAPPDALLFSSELAGRIIDGFRFLMPYYQWLYGVAVRAEAE